MSDGTIDLSAQGEWLLAEGVPGIGARPEWLSEKYNSAVEQAKAYPEAIKMAMNGRTGAPDQYDMSAFENVLSAEEPEVKEFLDYAKSNHMTQESVIKAIEVAAKTKQRATIDEAQELEKLGATGSQQKQVVEQWINNTVSSEAREAFSKMPKTAESIRVLDEIRQRQAQIRSASPSGMHLNSNFAPLTEAQIRQEIQDNSQKYLNNPLYRDEIQKKLRQVLGDN
jgi:hypothetical protein